MTESVWDYPRPPRVEQSSERVVVTHQGVVVADTTRSLRVPPTSHPPTYYLPRDAFADGVLRPGQGTRGASGRATRPTSTSSSATTCCPPSPGPIRRRRRASRCWPTTWRSTPAASAVHRGRRGRGAAARPLLRRLDHLPGDRPVQGDARHLRPARSVQAAVVGLPAPQVGAVPGLLVDAAAVRDPGLALELVGA